MCRLAPDNASAFSEHEVRELERGVTKGLPDARRSGCVGAWLSHISALKRFAAESEAQRGAGPAQRRLLLLLEDDAELAPAFFSQLPCLLRQAPSDPPWHVVRFSTWGARFEADRVAGSAGEVFRAAHHAYDGGGMATFAYGGAHAVLLQSSTADELLGYTTANGIRPIDAALREEPQPEHPHRRNASGPSRAPRRASFGTAVPRIRSYVIFTPLVNVSGAEGWRRAAAAPPA